jgi:hypothetical protein
MTPEARRAVAFIAGQIVSRKKRRSIYDYDKSGYIHFSGNVGSDVRLYDHNSRAHIQGSNKQFYHYGLRAHISLDVSGKNFSGYDYGSSSHFSGSVRHNNVTLYDYQASKHFQYLLT